MLAVYLHVFCKLKVKGLVQVLFVLRNHGDDDDDDDDDL
jgi:hypothetical protein